MHRTDKSYLDKVGRQTEQRLKIFFLCDTGTADLSKFLHLFLRKNAVILAQKRVGLRHLYFIFWPFFKIISSFLIQNMATVLPLGTYSSPSSSGTDWDWTRAHSFVPDTCPCMSSHVVPSPPSVAWNQCQIKQGFGPGTAFKESIFLDAGSGSRYYNYNNIHKERNLLKNENLLSYWQVFYYYFYYL